MGHNKIGFHLGPGGNPTGIGQYMAELDAAGKPFVIKSVDHYGMCYEAAQYTNAPHNIIFRLSTAGQNDGVQYDVPDYVLDPNSAAHKHWNATVAKLPPEFNKQRVWLEVINEIDKNRADWLGWFGKYIAQLAINDGYKIALFGWSSGEPEPEHWHTIGMEEYLRMCAEFPESCAVALHEYSYTVESIYDGYPNKIGRFEQLFAACDEMGIARPVVHITEWGWALNDIPDIDQALSDIDLVARDYAIHPQIRSAAIWYLGSGFGGIADETQKLIAPVTQYTLNVELPGEEPEPPPSAEQENLLDNPSFENGWWHIDDIPELQIANGWDVIYKAGPHDVDGEQVVFMRPEFRVLPSAYLPEDERELFVLHGDHVVKAFKGNGAIDFKYITYPKTIPAGRYTFVASVYPDLVMDYVDGQKVFADDPLAGEVRLFMNGIRGNWQSLFPFGEYKRLVFEFELETEQEVSVGINFRCRWGLQNNGWFLDDWALYKEGGEPPEPPQEPPAQPGLPRVQYRRIYRVLHPSVTTEQAKAVFADAVANRETVGFSFDDAGIGALDNKTVIIIGASDDDKQTFMDWYNEHYPGTIVDFEPVPDAEPGEFFFKYWPTQHRYINQAFGANPEYYGQFGLPGHEGVDIKAPHRSPIFSVAEGVVSDVHEQADGHNYGRFVRVAYAGGYEITYAHTDEVLVGTGEHVEAGQIICYANSTGNSSGSHLHITLKHKDAYEGGETYIGYPYKIVDPTPFLAPLMDSPPPVTGDVMLGIHTSSDGSLADGELAVLKTAKPELIKVMSSISPQDIAAIAAEVNPKTWIIRAFLDFSSRVDPVTPAQFVEWTISDVARGINALPDGADYYVELHNEPNLNAEGLGVSWANGTEFGAWLSSVITLYKHQSPDARLVYPGLSPGPTIVNIRKDNRVFLSGSLDAAYQCDAFGAHAYWSDQYAIEAAVAVIWNYAQTLPQKDIFVTEASNNKVADAVQKGHEYIEFVNLLSAIPKVKGVAYFVASASYGFDDEVWVRGGSSIGIAEVVGER